MAPFSLIALYALIPMGVAIIGGLIASFYTPQPKLTAALQHFVAGIVIGAVAIELLPKILGHRPTWTVGIGFLIGVALMLLFHELAHFLARKEGEKKVPIGLVVACALDLLIDGILIGVAFLAGEASGILIAISLSLCAFFLTLTVASTLHQRGVSQGIQWISIVGVAVMLPIGALIGSSVIAQFPPIILLETLAFGVAALLYLGVEELLVEAHQEKSAAWVCSAFFLGFLLILLFRG